MAGPPDLPTVRHYADGRQVLVTSMAEFDALEPGHADSPLGPFDAPPSGPEAAPPDATEDEGPREKARQMQREGTSQRAIAEALGVSPRTVRRLLAEGDDNDETGSC